jgi:Regulator of G protein signaling domain
MRSLWSAMRRSKRQKPSSFYLAAASRQKNPYCPSVLSGWDADDEGFMSSAEFLPLRPLSVSIPSGPYCPRRPTLQEVLANSASPPWTLSAFMAYLSQNHCLETLEFTMDASRYRKHYNTMMESSPSGSILETSEGCEYVKMLWQKLLDAYITPNGPREVNLPSDVRDALLCLNCTFSPPHPSVLEPAVKIIYELMDESVLVPFLNSVAPVRGPENCSNLWASPDDVPDMVFHGSLDERSLSHARPRSRRDQSPPSSGSSMDIIYSSCNGPTPRPSHHSHLSAALSRSSSRLSAYLSQAAPSAPDAQDAGLTDDSASSPPSSALEPMTPPTTPPTSDAGFAGISPGTSPRNSRGEGSGWRKMGAKLGWKKSRSGCRSNSSTSSGRYPLGRDTFTDDESTS